MRKQSRRAEAGRGSGGWRHLPAYPVLLAAFPVLHLAAHNAAELPATDWLGPLLLTSGIALAALLSLTLLARDSARAAFLTAVLVITFGYYGHISEALPSLALAVPLVSSEARYLVTFDIVRLAPPYFLWIGDQGVDFDRFFVPVWLATAVLALVMGIRRKPNWSRLIPLLNGATLFLVLLPSALLGRHLIAADEDADGRHPDNLVSLRPEEPPRDIYYLIFDRYGSDPVLKQFFEFDNSKFRQELEARGFYVTSNSFANYPQTMHSLASSLNFEYLDDVGDAMRSSESLTPLLERLENHRVGAMLQAAGYRYDHAGAWWVHTRNNRKADHVFRTYLGTEFTAILVDRSFPIRAAAAWGGKSPAAQRLLETLGYSRLARWRFLNAKFDWIERRGGRPEPAFIFGHFLLPHKPYTMDREGKFVTRGEELRRGRRVSYVEQVEAANRKVLRLVDSLLARSGARPIIVVQADEGPYPDRFYAHQGGPTEWKRATTGELRMKLGIMSAMYLPDRDSLPLHPGISPVNTFRIIFDAYFGTNYGLLPDRSYIFSGNFHEFWDVTDELHAPGSLAGPRSE